MGQEAMFGEGRSQRKQRRRKYTKLLTVAESEGIMIASSFLLFHIFLHANGHVALL